MLDVVLSQMHKFSCRPAASLRLCPGKCTVISSVPVFPVPFWSFSTSNSFKVGPVKRKDADMGSALLRSVHCWEKEVFLSHNDMLSFLCLVFLSELTFLLDSFLALPSGKFLKHRSRQKITVCPFNGMLRLNICLYRWFWLFCNFIN